MIRHLTIALMFYFLAISCANEVVPPIGEINQLEHAGAVMPVHIFGNGSATTAIIIVHGGPGESAILKREAIGFYKLEEDHQVVYYDQRGSGISEGNVSESSLTVEQMAQDLHAVVQLVAEGTGIENIFIISLDWGAGIAINYLASEMKSPFVKGYIASSPGFNVPLAMERSREELILIAEELLGDNNTINDGPAQNLKDFYERNPSINRFNYEEHYQLIEALGGIVINVEHGVSGVEAPAFVQSTLDDNLKFLLDHWSYTNGHFLESLDVEELVGELDIPVKLIWGFWDRLNPISLAERFQPLLSEASSGELISVFPESAHRPYLEEGDRFFATVATWVDFYD